VVTKGLITAEAAAAATYIAVIVMSGGITPAAWNEV